MKTEIKQKWIEALKSGKYKQAKGSLRNRGGFCCLGVLCDIYVEETGEKWVPRDFTIPETDEEVERYSCHDWTGSLPPEVREWAGFREDHGCGEYEEYGIDCKLSVDNDDGKSFDEIAVIIEKYL